jgi:hypothetical protein
MSVMLGDWSKQPMKAQISSSVNAHPLLHELERTAKGLPDKYSRIEVPYHGGTTGIGELHVSGTCEGEVLSVEPREPMRRQRIHRLNGNGKIPLRSVAISRGLLWSRPSARLTIKIAISAYSVPRTPVHRRESHGEFATP